MLPVGLGVVSFRHAVSLLRQPFFIGDGSATDGTPQLTASPADPRFFVQPDGRIIVNDGSTTLARLRPDGSADPTWTRTPITTGTNGTATSYGTPQACDFQSDGKIIVVVSGAGSPPGNITTLNLVRLNSDGTLDATFAPIALGLNATIRALRVLSDDRIQVVVFGTGGILQRFSPAGLFDGSAALTFNGGSVTAVAITSGGETWFSGSFVSLNGLGRSQLARLNNDVRKLRDIFVSAAGEEDADATVKSLKKVKEAEKLSVDSLQGKGDMRAVVDAVMSAEQSLQAAVAIRDKIVSAYLEISRMSI